MAPESDSNDRSDELLSDELKDTIESHRWSLTNLISKAKSHLSTGALVLSIVISGMLGFSGFFGGDSNRFQSLEELQVGTGYIVVLLGVGCLVIISLSIRNSVNALRVIDTASPLTYKNFARDMDGTGDIDEGVVEALATLPKKDLYKKIHKAHIRILKNLEIVGARMAKHTRKGQRYLMVGLWLGVAAAIVVLTTPAMAHICTYLPMCT